MKKKLLISILLITAVFAAGCGRNLKDNKYVVIKKSEIPGAGMGLFAAKDIPKGAIITAYEGTKITLKQLNELYAKNEHWYAFTIPECADRKVYEYIDGNRDHFASKVNFAPSIINGKKTGLQNTKFYYECEEPYIMLYAERDIKAGEELYTTYGDEYDYHFMNFPDVQKFFLNKTGIKLKKNEKFTFKE